MTQSECIDYIPPNATETDLRRHIIKLQRRIHNQRVALRQDWETVEMRSGPRQSKEVRSKWMAYWSAERKEVLRLRAQLKEL